MIRQRFGIVVPWMNRAVEDELPWLLRDLDIGLHWARVRPDPLPSGPDDEEYLPRLLAEVPRAIDRLAPDDLDAVIVACTSATIDVVSDDTRVTSAFECFESALSDGATMLCTPYSPRLTDTLATQLERHGHRIVSKALIPVRGEFRDVSLDAIATSITAKLTGDVRQVAVSCTALYTAGLAEVLRDGYDVTLPVITSISAIATHIRTLACHRI